MQSNKSEPGWLAMSYMRPPNGKPLQTFQNSCTDPPRFGHPFFRFRAPHQSGMGCLLEFRNHTHCTEKNRYALSPQALPGVQAGSEHLKIVKPSLSKRVSKHCPSSVQAPRNLSKRTFQLKTTPAITVSPGRRNAPELPLYKTRGVS